MGSGSGTEKWLFLTILFIFFECLGKLSLVFYSKFNGQKCLIYLQKVFCEENFWVDQSVFFAKKNFFKLMMWSLKCSLEETNLTIYYHFFGIFYLGFFLKLLVFFVFFL